MSLPSADLHLQQSSLDFEVRPTRDRGLVLFSGQLDSQSFLSISLHGGVLELRLQTLGKCIKLLVCITLYIFVT